MEPLDQAFFLWLDAPEHPTTPIHRTLFGRLIGRGWAHE